MDTLHQNEQVNWEGKGCLNNVYKLASAGLNRSAMTLIDIMSDQD